MKKVIISLLVLFLAVATLSATEGLMTGAGSAKITPTSDMYPMTWGSGNRGFAFIGAMEDIYVRVIALSNSGDAATPENTYLILGFDTGKGPYPPGFIRFLSNETGVPEDHIFWSTTHMHSGPEIKESDWADYLDMEIRTDTAANMLADLSLRNKARWGTMIEKQLLAAAEEAIASMRPAEVSLGTTTSYINVNRDTQYPSNLVQNPYDPTGERIPGTLEGYNGQGFSDKTLTVIEFRERNGGEPIAFIVHYAMHNVLLYANDYFNPAFFSARGTRMAETDDIEVGTYVPGNPDATVLSTKLEFNVAYCEPFEKNYRSIVSLTTADNVDGDTAANAAVHPDVGGLVSQYIEYNYPGSVALWVSGAAGDQNPVLRNTMNFESPYTGEVLEIPIDGGFLEAATYYASIQFRDVKNAINSMEEEDDFSDNAPIGTAYGTASVKPIDEMYVAYNAATGTYSDPVPYADVPLFMTVMRIGDITLAGVPNEPFNAIGVAMREETDLGGASKKNTLVINHSWTHEEETNHLSYYPDDVAISNNSHRWGIRVKYPMGVINDAYKDLLVDTWSEADPDR